MHHSSRTKLEDSPAHTDSVRVRAYVKPAWAHMRSLFRASNFFTSNALVCAHTHWRTHKLMRSPQATRGRHSISLIHPHTHTRARCRCARPSKTNWQQDRHDIEYRCGFCGDAGRKLDTSSPAKQPHTHTLYSIGRGRASQLVGEPVFIRIAKPTGLRTRAVPIADRFKRGARWRLRPKPPV